VAKRDGKNGPAHALRAYQHWHARCSGWGGPKRALEGANVELHRTHRQAFRTQGAAQETRKTLVPWRRRRMLLLIEDDTEMRRMLAASLRRDGHVVVEAANGDDALDWLGPGVLDGDVERMPDLIVSDIRLPYFSGLEILESLQVAARRIPVILITGFPDRETHTLAAQLGATCVIEKPFDLAELRAAVRLALRARGADPSPGPDVASS
jgi:CheY-like chemotaxis protein